LRKTWKQLINLKHKATEKGNGHEMETDTGEGNEN
jgi:hypothetical protein